MLSAWAILSIAAGTFGLQNDLNNARDGSVTLPGGGVPPGGSAGGGVPPGGGAGGGVPPG